MDESSTPVMPFCPFFGGFDVSCYKYKNYRENFALIVTLRFNIAKKPDIINPKIRVLGALTPRVRVPKYGILGPQSPCIGGTLRPKYSLFRYMDP